ncbi:MAG: MarR family transcriptional regulator [Chloroflexota bacterium]
MRRSAHDILATARQTGLSGSQMRTLFQLYHRGACPITGLSGSLDVTAAAASHLVERLVQMGLLAREEDPSDRRVRRVVLTDAGRLLVSRLIEARHQWLSQLTAALTPDQQKEVVRALGYLTEAARAVEPEAGVEGEPSPQQAQPPGAR